MKLFNEYYSIASEAKYKTKYGEGLKILTPKQMLKRLPMCKKYLQEQEKQVTHPETY